ncbi:MAG: FAD-binding oxidoreductase [Bacteroidota bacterium]
MSKSYLLPVEKVIRETADTISLCFRQPKIDRIPYHAGQYLTVKVEVGGQTLYRSYSLSSTPRLDEFTQITIKEVPDGKVSTYLNREIEAGEYLEFSRSHRSILCGICHQK